MQAFAFDAQLSECSHIVSFGDDSVRRLISVPFNKVKKILSRINPATGSDIQQFDSSATWVPLDFYVALSPYMVLPERSKDVLFKDLFSAYEFDSSVERQQLRRTLNNLLDAYYELKPPIPIAIFDEPELLPDGLDEDERIEQVAAQFIETHGWPLSALSLVKDVFHRFGWSATRVALDTVVENGMSVSELALAFHLKNLWEASDKYSQNSKWYNLAWPTALEIIRSFHAYPQKEELERFLEDQYDRWLYAPPLYQQSHYFLSYILRRCRTESVSCIREGSRILENFDEVPFNNYTYPESYDIGKVQLQKRLIELGLI